MLQEGNIEKKLEQKGEIRNTNQFREALSSGHLEEAENFLTKVLSDPEQFPQYDARWLDHRQRELFQAFYQQGDWLGAKRIVEATKDKISQEGRKDRLEELSEMDYDEI